MSYLQKILSKDRVKDYCHITGLYKKAADNTCNVNYKISKTVPVIFHSLKGYDSHFIIQKS